MFSVVSVVSAVSVVSVFNVWIIIYIFNVVIKYKESKMFKSESQSVVKLMFSWS